MPRPPRRLALLALAAVALAAALRAQDLPPPGPAPAAPPAAPGVSDARLDRLVGTWIGRGALDGQPTLEVWSAAWALDHQFLSVVATRTVVGDGARPTTERQVFLRPAGEGAYRGVALDTGGALVTLRARVERDAAGGEALVVEAAAPAQGEARPAEPAVARWTVGSQGLDVRRLEAGAEVGRVLLERH